MTRSNAGVAAVLGVLLAAQARAAPPQINATTPFGATRGVATEVTIGGANLAGNPRLVAPFGFTVAPTTVQGDAASAKFALTVAPDTALGVYPIRVRTDDGLSNPFLFSVGQLPQVAEKEDNSTFESAQAIPAPAVVEGQAAGNDVDYFRFAGKKGQRVVVDAQCARIGSGVDPTIRLTTAGRAYVASADDSPGLLTDARLWVELPEDGDYVVELSDTRYQGGGRPVYRLVVGAVPMAEEIYPIGGRRGETVEFEVRGGTLAGLRKTFTRVATAPGSDAFRVRLEDQVAPDAPGLDVESIAALDAGDLPEVREAADPSAPPARATVPVVLNGRIDPAGDEDRFVLAVTPGQALHIDVEAAESGSALDGILQVLGAGNAVLATGDDTTIPPQGGKKGKAAGIVSPDPSLDFTVAAGLAEITLALRDLEGRGGVGFPYRITVTPVAPRFEIAPSDAQVSVPRGGTAVVGVAIVRKGYNGPIALSVANPPAGLSVRPGSVADGQVVGTFSVSAAADAAFETAHLDVIGQGQGPGGPIVAHANKPIVFAQQGTLPTNSITQIGLFAAPAAPSPVTLDAPAAPIEVAHGFGAAFPVKVARTPGAETALAVTPLPLPPGLAVPAVNLDPKAAEGNVAVNAAVETAPGAVTIGLVAKGKIANVEQTFAIPAVTLQVVRPAALELAVPSLEVKPGATVELKGKVVRKGPFREPVTVKVDGLPAGLKANPVSVAPDKAEFTLAVVADPKAAATSASARVTMAFQVNKKDYPVPPSPLAVKVSPAP